MIVIQNKNRIIRYGIIMLSLLLYVVGVMGGMNGIEMMLVIVYSVWVYGCYMYFFKGITYYYYIQYQETNGYRTSNPKPPITKTLITTIITNNPHNLPNPRLNPPKNHLTTLIQFINILPNSNRLSRIICRFSIIINKNKYNNFDKISYSIYAS